MKLSEKMLQILREMGFDLSEEATIERIYAGHWQRAAGAWSWIVTDPVGTWGGAIGGHDTLTNLVKCPNLTVLQSGPSDRDANIECSCEGTCEGQVS